MNTSGKNWICYDAECAFCVRWANRFRARLEARGFILLPLQSMPVREALRVPENELLAEMRVVTTDGRVFGGADALVFLSGVACKPLFAITRITGTKLLLRGFYRFIARHRGCADGACRIRRARAFRAGNPADWLPLLTLVLATAVFGRRFAPWLYMWALAAALFAGCKWLCFRKELARGTKTSLGRKIGFLFGWIGMDAASFFTDGNAVKKPRAIEWAFAFLKIAFGSVLIWAGTRRALAIHPLLAGWTGMVGLIFVLHFGLLHLLSLAWRAAGVNAAPLMRAPLLSRSLGEFWGERWNTAFNALANRFLFRPLRRGVGIPAATMGVFFASGLIHDLVISVPAGGGYGLPTVYFLVQGAGVLFEHTKFARRRRLNRGFRGWLFTFIVTAGPVFWLFHPTFIRNVILPFLAWIGAT